MLAIAVAIVVGVSRVTSNKMDGTEFMLLLGLLGAAASAAPKNKRCLE